MANDSKRVGTSSGRSELCVLALAHVQKRGFRIGQMVKSQSARVLLLQGAGFFVAFIVTKNLERLLEKLNFDKGGVVLADAFAAWTHHASFGYVVTGVVTGLTLAAVAAGLIWLFSDHIKRFWREHSETPSQPSTISDAASKLSIASARDDEEAEPEQSRTSHRKTASG
jgi:hypothetical protein